MQSDVNAPFSCPLCAYPKSGTVLQLTGRELAEIWRELGQEFTPAAWGRIEPQFVVALKRCERCGFRFFDPSLAGNAVFYHELEQREGYYAPVRPEFPRTLAFARQRKLRRVLDVGCGSGAFLDLAKEAGCETCGIELNTAAGEKAGAKGHRIFPRLLHELDLNQTGGGFDLISFFQVLEHVPDPAGVLRQAGLFLNPGGFVSVSLPFSNGVYRLAPWQPHQWPPHHISLWRLADLEQLGRAAGLSLVARGGDVLLGSDIERLWKAHNLSTTALKRRPYLGGSRLPAILSLVYRKTGMKHIFPHWGNSIYGYFQKR